MGERRSNPFENNGLLRALLEHPGHAPNNAEELDRNYDAECKRRRDKRKLGYEVHNYLLTAKRVGNFDRLAENSPVQLQPRSFRRLPEARESLGRPVLHLLYRLKVLAYVSAKKGRACCIWT